MARKKQEIALQTEINAQEEWDEQLTKESLLVVDVYQDWCGPCKSMTSFFRRLKNEIGDDLLQFAVAKSDGIESLERYRGKCEPCFLLYGCGYLVGVIRGANPPELERLIKMKLDEEKKVIRGEMERQEIKDPALLADETEKVDEEAEEKDEVEVEVTLALIKPDAVEAGKVDEIIQKLTDMGIEILRHEERHLTEDEARSFYAHLENMEFFDQLITFMSSGTSHVLALAKTNGEIINEFRELMGPPEVEVAKEEAPTSLRAQYGTETFKNAFHAADSKDKALKELAFFFPDFKAPTIKVSREKQDIQRTLALIRPDAYMQHKDSIRAKIEELGFNIVKEKEIQLTAEQAQEFYEHQKESEFYEELVTRMTNGPCMALMLAKNNAVSAWRDLLGPANLDDARFDHPNCLRAMFAVDDVNINQLHGADSNENAMKEINYFFPIEQTLVVVKPDAFDNRDEIIEAVKEAGFTIAVQKEETLTPEVAQELYKDHTDKEYFNELIEHMCSGPSLLMVLSKVDAVKEWRSLMGVADPEKALTENPDSLRASYGTDVKKNAIHGSSTVEAARESIKLIFGDVEFQVEAEADASVVKSDERIVMEAEEADAEEETTEEKSEEDKKEDDAAAEKPTEEEPKADESEEATDKPATEAAAE